MNKTYPKIRFKVFNDKLEKHLLGDVCSVGTGGKDTQNKVENGLYPFFVRSNTVERINSYSYDGEAILTSGDGVGVGKNFHYINGKFDFHQRVYALHNFKKGFSGKYIFQVFVEKFYKRVIRLSAKNSVDSVRMNMITEMPIYFPSLQEQQKIASFLSIVDEKIRHLIKKKQLLEQYKKGVMQQLFSGKLRFKDENGKAYPKWEKKRLGEVGTIIRGASPRPQGDKRYYGGNVPRLMVKDVTRDGKYVTPSTDFLTEEGSKLSRPCKAGTLTIVCSGTVGIPSFLAVDACIHDGFLALIDIDSKYNHDYIYHNLTTLREKFESSATHGGVFTNLTTGAIKDFEVVFPSLIEQTRIACFLTGIDAKIENVTTQITQTQTFKKGLLQQMFV